MKVEEKRAYMSLLRQEMVRKFPKLMFISSKSPDVSDANRYSMNKFSHKDTVEHGWFCFWNKILAERINDYFISKGVNCYVTEMFFADGLRYLVEIVFEGTSEVAYKKAVAAPRLGRTLKSLKQTKLTVTEEGSGSEGDNSVLTSINWRRVELVVDKLQSIVNTLVLNSASHLPASEEVRNLFFKYLEANNILLVDGKKVGSIQLPVLTEEEFSVVLMSDINANNI